eukprot:COSAG03_NODE_671_length_6365_cov_25.745292_4_plen_290_part_00
MSAGARPRKARARRSVASLMEPSPTALPSVADVPRGSETDTEPPAAPEGGGLLRRVLAVFCVVGIPIANTASVECGQHMEMRLAGGSYKHGFAIAWLNHSVLIVFLVPWALLVMAEKGCSCGALWKAMAGPYGSGRRLGTVTFWLAFQYQLFNYACRLRSASLCSLATHICHKKDKETPALAPLICHSFDKWIYPPVQVLELAAVGVDLISADDLPEPVHFRRSLCRGDTQGAGAAAEGAPRAALRRWRVHPHVRRHAPPPRGQQRLGQQRLRRDACVTRRRQRQLRRQ